MSESFELAGRTIGDGRPCFVIAEAGVNHDGDLGRALELVDVAAGSGADAVKFQTFSAAELASDAAEQAAYQRERAEAESQRAMLERLELPREAFEAIAARCAQRGIVFLSTPFDMASAQMLIELGVPALKVGSGELTNTPLLRELATTGVPLIVSTGMATLDEVTGAVEAVARAPALALLHCVSSYPAPAAEANLRVLDTLRRRFGVPVGWSDHCLEPEVALAAVARGAVIVERHFTLDRTLPGPDHAMSDDPAMLAELIRRIRVVEAALGDGEKRPQPSEADVRAVARRSIVAARDLAEGETVDAGAVAIKRPGGGLAPAEIERVIGARVRRAVARNTPLVAEDIER